MFEYYKGKIILKKEKIDSKALKSFVENLKAEEALSVALYIYLLLDRGDDNPVRDLRFEERLQEAEDISKLNENISATTAAKIDLLMSKYTKEMTSKIQSDIDVYDKKMFQFIALLNTTTPVITKTEHEKTGNVYFSTNIDIITEVLKSIMKIIVDKAQVVGMQKSGKFVQSLRGSLSPNMKGKTTQIK